MLMIRFPLSSFPELETANLRLREMRPGDAAAVYRIFSDEQVTRTIDLESLNNVEQAAELIRRQQARFERGEAIRWGIAQRADDIVIGSVGCVVSSRNAQGDLGYDLARPYWRHGIMTEALRIVIRFCFMGLDLNRLQALVMPHNVASAGLLAKLGFQEEGLLREYAFFKGRFQDLRCFSMLKREYKKKAAEPDGYPSTD